MLRHSPPFWHGDDAHASFNSSHLAPVNSAEHEQVKLPQPLKSHVPVLRQRFFDEHGLIHFSQKLPV
jgi:hypothetical protein